MDRFEVWWSRAIRLLGVLLCAAGVVRHAITGEDEAGLMIFFGLLVAAFAHGVLHSQEPE